MSKSSTTIWNRLEARPRSQEIERTLRSEIRDPLWMLTRQWQFGEFLGEDTGSALFSRVKYLSTSLDKVALGNHEAENYNPDLPLEAVVEREGLTFDLHLRILMGRHWFKMLRKGFTAEQARQFITAFKSDDRLHFRLPAKETLQEKFENASELSRPALMQVLETVAGGRMIDGAMLYIYLKNNAAHTASDFLDERSAAVDELGQQYVQWFERVYGSSVIEKRAWHPSHLEYQFHCTTTGENESPKLLSVKEYHGGRLEWYNFDYGNEREAVPRNLRRGLRKSLLQEQVAAFIPAAVHFPGMPNARFWELEDSRINFGEIHADATDTAKLVFTQFGLLFGNDWLSFPLELPVGSLTKIESLQITDVFGQKLIIPHVHQFHPNEYWSMFQLHDLNLTAGQQNDAWFFLAPATGQLQQGPPLEKVNMIRDEMANMVWGVENVIPDGLGSGTDGFEFAVELQEYLDQLIPQEAVHESLPNSAELKYLLSSRVPENWIPFIAVKLKASATGSRSIQLQRAAMPRILPGFPARRIRPQTSLLREGEFKSPYFVFEEEVPRAGAMLTLRWHRTRWHNGEVISWLGRQKTTGKGERSSGLRFDFLELKT